MVENGTFRALVLAAIDEVEAEHHDLFGHVDCEFDEAVIALRSAVSVTVGSIEHSNSMCQKTGCTCWCQACERHNWRHDDAAR